MDSITSDPSAFEFTYLDLSPDIEFVPVLCIDEALSILIVIYILLYLVC